MNILKPCNSSNTYIHFLYHFNSSKLTSRVLFQKPKLGATKFVTHVKTHVARASNMEAGKEDEGETKTEKRNFLSLEEAGLVEISGLNTHERFLCRLTISSLNLLRVIAEQEGCTIEELNAGKICDWFLKDKLKREQNIGSAVLHWDEDDPFEF